MLCRMASSRIVSHRYRFYFCVIDLVFVLRTRREGATIFLRSASGENYAVSPSVEIIH